MQFYRLLPDGGDLTNFCSSNFGVCGTWDCDGTSLVIDDIPLPNGLIKMQDYIKSAGKVLSPNTMVTFEAGQYIELPAQFEVTLGTVFEATIKDCSK